MRLVNDSLGISLKYNENTIDVLIIENQKVFSEFVGDLWRQANGEIGDTIISENDKELKISSMTEVVFNPFALNINDKKIITKIYDEIKVIALEEHSEELAALNQKNILLLDSLLARIPYHLTYDLEMDITQLFKSYNISMDAETESLSDVICDYIRISAQVLKRKVFIFLNLKQYISTDDIQNIYEFVKYEKVWLILIESIEGERHTDEHVCIIDDQWCKIEVN